MKLRLDENLSRRIVSLLQADYPGSSQVALLQLETATDREIWDYAKANDFVIVTRDSDFHELGTLYGAPPKLIWLKTGNRVSSVRVKGIGVYSFPSRIARFQRERFFGNFRA